MTTWAEIRASPWFEDRLHEIVQHIVSDHMLTADNPDAYREFVNGAVRDKWPIGVHPASDGLTVKITWGAINSRILPVSSFLPGAEIVAVETMDVDEMPEADE